MDVKMTQKVGEIVKQVCQKEGIVGDIVEEYSIMVEQDVGHDQTMTLGGGKTMTMGRTFKTLGQRIAVHSFPLATCKQ